MCMCMFHVHVLWARGVCMWARGGRGAGEGRPSLVRAEEEREASVLLGEEGRDGLVVVRDEAELQHASERRACRGRGPATPLKEGVHSWACTAGRLERGLLRRFASPTR